MPENNQPIEEKAAAEKRNLDHEELLLLLELNVVYSTGDILDHLQLDVRVPEAEKSELRDRRSRAQSYLSRYLFQKEGALHRFFESDLLLAENAKLILTPIRKEPYRGKRVNQRLYLGAQYVYVAERLLGRKTTIATKELLGLIAQAQESPTRFSKSEFVRGIYKGRHGASVVPHTKIQSLLKWAGLRRPATPGVTVAASGNTSISIPKSLVRGFLFVALGLTAGLASGKYLYHETDEEILRRFERIWVEKGPSVFESIDKTYNPQNDAELVIMAWQAAIDPEQNFSSVEKLAKPLINHKSPKYAAKGYYTLGVAQLKRGNLDLAIIHLNNSISILENEPGQKGILRVAYLYLAECYFYLGETESVFSSIDEAKSVDTNKFRSQLYRFEGLYWLMIGNLDQAEVSIEKALRLSLLEGDSNMTGVYHSNLALVMIGQNDLLSAYHHINAAENLSIETKNDRLLDFVLGLRMYWSEEMGLPYENIAHRLRQTTDPVNGGYVNSLIDLSKKAKIKNKDTSNED